MSRLEIDAGEFFEADDLRGAVNFTTPDTLNAIGFATSDIAEMGLSEISKTIQSLDRANRIIAENRIPDYNEAEIKPERSNGDERNQLHDAGRLQSAESGDARTAGGDTGTLRTDAPQVSEGEPQSSVLQPADEMQADGASGRNRTESIGNGRNAFEYDS